MPFYEYRAVCIDMTSDGPDAERGDIHQVRDNAGSDLSSMMTEAENSGFPYDEGFIERREVGSWGRDDG